MKKRFYNSGKHVSSLWYADTMTLWSQMQICCGFWILDLEKTT